MVHTARTISATIPATASITTNATFNDCTFENPAESLFNIGNQELAKINVTELLAENIPEKQYKPLPKYPATTRDFSFVCDEDMEVGAIEGVMAKAGGKLVESVALFDIYRGPQIGEGKKSVSFAAMLRAAERTLTDEEADGAVKKILKRLEAECGAVLRS